MNTKLVVFVLEKYNAPLRLKLGAYLEEENWAYAPKALQTLQSTLTSRLLMSLEMAQESPLQLQKLTEVMAGQVGIESEGMLRKSFSKILRDPEIAVNFPNAHKRLLSLSEAMFCIDCDAKLPECFRGEADMPIDVQKRFGQPDVTSTTIQRPRVILPSILDKEIEAGDQTMAQILAEESPIPGEAFDGIESV